MSTFADESIANITGAQQNLSLRSIRALISNTEQLSSAKFFQCVAGLQFVIANRNFSFVSGNKKYKCECIAL